MNKRFLASWLLLVTISSSALPQQPSSAPTPPMERPNAQPQQPDTQDPDDGDVARIRTNLVQIDAVVTKDGKPVTDLRPEDFEIFEDGKKTVFAAVGSMNRTSLCCRDALQLSARALRFIVEGMGELPGRKSMVIL